MGRTIFIGDVHGCREELAELMAVLQPHPGADRVIFVGALVNKGPDSLGVLRDVQRILRTFPGSVCVSGNHEEKALRDVKKGNNEGCPGEPWLFEATLDDLGFMDSMPLTWYDPELNIRVVHGGIFPALLEKHPDAFARIEARGNAWRKGGGKVMNRARRMLRVRYVDAATGDMLALGENKPDDPFWGDVYNGAQGHVIYGHSPLLDGNAREDDYATGIDTACVFGACLTAMVVTPDSPAPNDWSFRYVTAMARQQYREPYKEGEEDE